MIVFCMFGDGSLGVAFVSTPSTGHGNINRIACAFVTGYGILRQGLVTYHAEKSVVSVTIYF